MKFLMGLLSVFAAVALGAHIFANPGKNTSWKEIGVERLELNLVSTTSVGSFNFRKQGTVAAAFGTKTEFTAPILFWRIEGNDLIISEEPTAKPLFELQDPRFTDDIVSVRVGLFRRSDYKMTRRAP